MATLTAFHKIGRSRKSPRIWLESARLEAAGFPSGAAYSVVPSRSGRGLCIIPGGTRNVSSRRAAGGSRPIIELTGQILEQSFPGIESIKARSSWKRIEITPTIRAASILKACRRRSSFSVFELFAGGGTLSDAVAAAPQLQIRGGAEIEHAYADIWGRKHPDADLFTGDIRLIHPAELPKFDILVAGIPCTSHSTMGRAKKSLKGRPEEGDTGDLFAWVLNIVAHRCPAACVFENVPSFGESLAGSVLKAGLRHLGYHLSETIVSPHHKWGEPSERKRWVLVATLEPGFSIETPQQPGVVSVVECLDPEDDDADQADANHIARTIEGLRRHNARHAAKGNGFSFTTITRESEIVPTIPKSYHKINSGPFVETKFGPRLLRLHEMEAIMGATAGTSHYATGVQVIGQGVQTRLWARIFQQLGRFLSDPQKFGNGELLPISYHSNQQLDLFQNHQEP